MKRDVSTPENREFWEHVDATAEKAQQFPEWKRGGKSMTEPADIFEPIEPVGTADRAREEEMFKEKHDNDCPCSPCVESKGTLSERIANGTIGRQVSGQIFRSAVEFLQKDSPERNWEDSYEALRMAAFAQAERISAVREAFEKLKVEIKDDRWIETLRAMDAVLKEMETK